MREPRTGADLRSYPHVPQWNLQLAMRFRLKRCHHRQPCRYLRRHAGVLLPDVEHRLIPQADLANRKRFLGRSAVVRQDGRIGNSARQSNCFLRARKTINKLLFINRMATLCHSRRNASY